MQASRSRSRSRSRSKSPVRRDEATDRPPRRRSPIEDDGPRKRPDRDRPRRNDGGFRWKEKRRDDDGDRGRDGDRYGDRGRDGDRYDDRGRDGDRYGDRRQDRGHDYRQREREKVRSPPQRERPTEKPTERREESKNAEPPKRAAAAAAAAPVASGEPMIIVNVNDRLGTKAAIPCLASDPIGLFKAQVAARVGRQPHEILLKRQGERPFKDALTLEDYGVSNGVQLDLELDTGD